jgi:hypothetical protein
VANVTLERAEASRALSACVPGATTCQQRQNLGATRIWGWQNDVDYRLGTRWRVVARLSVQPGEGEGIRRQPGDCRQVPAAGTDTSRLESTLAFTDPKIVSLSGSVMFFGVSTTKT